MPALTTRDHATCVPTITGSRASAAPKGAGVPTRFPSEVTKPNGRVRLSRPITALTVRAGDVEREQPARPAAELDRRLRVRRRSGERQRGERDVRAASSAQPSGDLGGRDRPLADDPPVARVDHCRRRAGQLAAVDHEVRAVAERLRDVVEPPRVGAAGEVRARLQDRAADRERGTARAARASRDRSCTPAGSGARGSAAAASRRPGAGARTGRRRGSCRGRRTSPPRASPAGGP